VTGWSDIRRWQALGMSTGDILDRLAAAGVSVRELGPPPDVDQPDPRAHLQFIPRPRLTAVDMAEGRRVCPACGCELAEGSAPSRRFCVRVACVRARAAAQQRRSRQRMRRLRLVE